jgi:hypothetical protein
MPSAWRVHVIGARLAAEGIDAVVVEKDIYALEGADRTAVLDAMVRDGADLPMVLIGGVVASAGTLDLDAIARAASGVAERE